MKLKLAAVAVLGAVGVGALVYAFGGLGTATAQGPDYLTTTASIGNVTADIAATGTLAPTARTAVAFGVEPWIVSDSATTPSTTATFQVTEVTTAVGDTVKAGDPLAIAESPELERQLTAAKNDLASAKISMNTAETAVSNASTTAALRQAKISRYNATNQLADAQARVDELKAQLALGTLTAPIDGIVTEVSITAGFDAPAGAAVVIDAPGFQVTTNVVESDLASVAVGQTATVSIGAVDAEVTGTVTTISPVTSASGSSVVSFPVTVTLDDVPGSARAGMSADVTITIASATDVLVVPVAALMGRGDTYSVRTLGEDGQPVVTPVEVGLVTETAAEITSGLAAGTAVVTGTTADLAGGTTTTGGFGGGGFGGLGGGPVGGGFPGGGGPNGGFGGGNGGRGGQP
jgi:macrolide-specific efflux system membrane fusion protein